MSLSAANRLHDMQENRSERRGASPEEHEIGRLLFLHAADVDVEWILCDVQLSVVSFLIRAISRARCERQLITRVERTVVVGFRASGRGKTSGAEIANWVYSNPDFCFGDQRSPHDKR
jgi:hypothetical protein